MTEPTPTKTLPYWPQISAFWWEFFDRIALISWPKMLLWSLLAFLIFGMLDLPALFFLAIFATLAMKILAGGKRRAENIAKAALHKADIETLQRQLLEAKIAALQAQIEPHFLFNTLALIGQLIEVNPSEAARIHTQLINYLRAAIPQMRSGSISTLASQVELSRAYLTIMQARMGDRLAVDIAIPESLNEKSFPPLMLQSLVENAIQHGLELKVQGGNICIRAHELDNILWGEVIDDGVGFDLNSLAGTGLTNIRERLKILYAGRAELRIEILASGGTKVSIGIPIEMQ